MKASRSSSFDHQLQTCLKLIEDQLDWPNSLEWQNGHFELLSQKIFDKTSIKLSAVTLKRVWGKVSYDSSPSMSTLDALAGFLDFENWIDFQETFSKKTAPPIKLFRKVKPIKLSYVLGFLIIGLLTGFLLSRDYSSPKLLPKVAFDFEPVTQGIPNTVNFTYDVSKTGADSAFIQQSWDERLRFQIPMDQHFYASTYFYPGFYRAKLVLNEDVIQERKLLVPSNGWLAVVEKEPTPIYRHENQLSEGYPDIDIAFLEENGYDLHEEVPLTHLFYVGGLEEVPMDDTHFETRFQHTFSKGDAVCQYGRIILLCTDGPILIPFSIPGCVGDLSMKLVDHWLEGNMVDMTGLGLDFSQEVKMDIHVKGLQLQVMVNEQLAFQRTLKTPPGDMVGVSYRFHGTGQIYAAVVKPEGEEIVLR
ncbi:MAG: hypothetical protein AAF388_12250 [Bacteroidota bacterium]